MTRISLRVYNREIEGMIESGQVDEAIAHCQHIFKTFPMHLETYRLLGKAFLETRRYVDAADIFQRVLMSVPEDFVSHVGMSIIRDDENKLDEAIWHMERAFEVQPSNPAIQDELRKLYGRRDGVQPPKVRLTRDALANMYTQGALYSQAIAEIRAVLADDPNRPDLQVMLARAYSKDGRKKQAIEICTELLKKYPYCFDALRILIDLMPPTDQHEFTQTYRLRVRALDPYAGFVTGSIFNSDEVPDAAVNIELLDYDPNQMEKESQPAWASTLGISLESDEENGNVPDWLSEKTKQEQSFLDEEENQAGEINEEEASPDNEDIPDWMRSSGWEKPDDLTTGFSETDESEIDHDEQIARADIPEWLKDMAPDDESTEDVISPDKFESLLDEKSMDLSVEDKLVPASQESAILEEKIDNEPSREEFPDWLNEIEDEETIKESIDIPSESDSLDTVQNEISTIFSEKTRVSNELTNERPVEDVDSWLEGVQQEATTESGDFAIQNEDSNEELPDWLKGIGSDEQTRDLEKQDESGSDFQGMVEDFSTDQDQIESPVTANSEEELPEWLKEIGASKDDIPSTDGYIAEMDDRSTIIYSEVGEKDTPTLEFISVDVRDDSSNEVPSSIIDEQSQDIEQNDAGSLPLDDQDAAMAWLESLAARQGAKPEELLTKPEDRKEEPPEWAKSDFVVEPIIAKDEETSSVEVPGRELEEDEWVSEKFIDNSVDEAGQKEPDHKIEFAPQEQESLSSSPEVGSMSIEKQEDELALDQDRIEEPQSEIKTSQDMDVAAWLKGLDANDLKIDGEAIAPKVAEFYGNEKSEPLPDWLSEIEKQTTSSEWIPESEDFSKINYGKVVSDTEPDKKDIDDIGEIFPTDVTNWTFEKSETEQEFEPLNEVVTPVDPSEWHPASEEENKSRQENLEIPEPEKFPLSEDYPQSRETGGTGMLSKIPAKDIEKEAGTLEQAQAYIENGELQKAINTYARLIKKGQLLESVIHDLRETTYRYPLEIGIWQSLGDAYMRANQLQDALDSYTRAEELLR